MYYLHDTFGLRTPHFLKYNFFLVTFEIQNLILLELHFKPDWDYYLFISSREEKFWESVQMRKKMKWIKKKTISSNEKTSWNFSWTNFDFQFSWFSTSFISLNIIFFFCALPLFLSDSCDMITFYQSFCYHINWNLCTFLIFPANSKISMMKIISSVPWRMMYKLLIRFLST